MPSLRVHCAMSKERTGRDFKELHEWMDAPYKKYGHNHRLKRHAYTERDEKFIREHWDKKQKGLGDKAVVEWLFHIAIDNLSTSFKKAKRTYGKRAYNYFIFGLSHHTRFIRFDFDRLTEHKLEDIFDKQWDDDEGDDWI